METTLVPQKAISEFYNISKMPSKTYFVDFQNKYASGFCNATVAMRQAIFKHLQTKRYAYKIYDDQYGTELFNIIGKNYYYAKSEAKRNIKEALLVDERIIDVFQFEFEKIRDFSNNLQQDKQSFVVSFVCETVFGDIDMRYKI